MSKPVVSRVVSVLSVVNLRSSLQSAGMKALGFLAFLFLLAGMTAPAGAVTLTLPASGALPAATANVAYSGTISATGGSGSGYVFTVNGTSIPTTGTAVPIANGISVSSTGTRVLTISGAPTAVGTVTLTNVTVVDSVNHTAGPDTYTIAVQAGYAVSGQIVLNNYCGSPLILPPFTVSINTKPVQTTTTDGNGNYIFASVPNGTYYVTPSITGPSSAFYPAMQTGVVVNSGAVTVKSMSAALGYTISGTVNYSGTFKTGRIFIQLANNTCNASVGTSIPAAGTFTIHGAAPGSYTLWAWRDNRGYGVQNASNPISATSSLVVSGANLTGVSVTLNDPAAVTLSTAPSLTQVSAFQGGAVVQFNPIEQSGVEAATSYLVEWSLSKTFAGIAGSRTLAAVGGHPWFISGIANGSTYYFRAMGNAGASKGPWSNVVGPIAIGAPAGANTLSGEITFSQTATGPMFVGVYDQNTNAVYATTLGSKTSPPTSPASYTLQVPSGSNYFFFAILDQNNNGLIDPGDITNINGYNMITPTLVVSGNTAGNLTLPGGNSVAVVRSGNDVGLSEWSGSTHTYELDFDVTGMAKQPVAVTITSGPNMALPIDAEWCQGCGYDPNSSYSFYSTIGTVIPKVGAVYGIRVTYSDGSQDTFSPTITAVVPSPLSLSPQGPVSNTNTKPALKWTYPANPSNYLYQMWFADQNYATVWSIPNVNSNTNSFTSSIAPSIPWGTDPTGTTGNLPEFASLTDGNVYHWEVVAYDANGNRGQDFVDYVPGFKPLSLPAANPGSLGPAYLYHSYSGSIGAQSGYGGYSYAINGIYNCYGCNGIPLGNGLYVTNAQNTLNIGGIPTANGTVSFDVYARDASSNNPVGPVTYTIAITDVPVSLPAAGSNPLGVPVAGVPYGGLIAASGGTGGANYSFTVNGVGIPTNSTYVSVAGADGLTFASSGESILLAAGTPVASGTFPIDVTVTDTTETSNTASVTYSVVVNGAPNGANNGYAKGTYVCKTNGFSDGSGAASVTLSSVVLDGKGNISGGVFDSVASGVTTAHAGTITGTYSVGADNNGIAITKSVLTTGGTGTSTNTWLLALTNAGEPSSPAQQFSMVEADDVGATPSGSTATAKCYLATTAAFAVSTISGKSFAFAQQGTNSTGTPKEYVGRFTASTATGTGGSATGTIANGYEDGMRVDQTGDSGGAFTGTYTGPGTKGRFTFAVVPTGTTATYRYAAYIIDANRMFILEIAGDTGVLSGDMRTQHQATYSNANADGAAVLFGQGIEYSNSIVSGFDSSIFEVSGNGAGTLTVNQSYDNIDGTYVEGKENAASVAVTFDSSNPGRATFSPGSDSAFLYFYDTNSAFYLDLNGGGSLNFLESGMLEPQTQTTFTDAALAGNYMLSDLPLRPDFNTIGEVDAATTGAVTGALSAAGQYYSIFDESESGMTYSWLNATYGAFSENGSTCMVVTPTSIICMSDSSSSAKMSILQQ